jgi:hypothetical protein
VHRTFECKFAADVAGTVQAALAAEEIFSLDDVVAVLDEARIGRCLSLTWYAWRRPVGVCRR